MILENLKTSLEGLHRHILALHSNAFRLALQAETWLIFNKEVPADFSAFLRGSEIPFGLAMNHQWSVFTARRLDAVRELSSFPGRMLILWLCNCVYSKVQKYLDVEKVIVILSVYNSILELKLNSEPEDKMQTFRFDFREYTSKLTEWCTALFTCAPSPALFKETKQLGKLTIIN